MIEGDLKRARLTAMKMSKAVRKLVGNIEEAGLTKASTNAEKGGNGEGKPKSMKKAPGDAPKDGDVISNPDIKVGRGKKIEVEEDPDVEKDKEDEEGGEDETEYKETSDQKEDKLDLEGETK